MNDAVPKWPVTNEDQLLAYYDAAFDPTYRAAARLTRGDRDAAEDLVQDGFMRLIGAVRGGEVDEVGIGWMITTVRRRFIDRLRSSEREKRRIRLVAAEPTVRDQPIVRSPSLLDELSDRERAALVFRYVEDLPVAEVADLLGTTVRATESLLQRAKQKARGSEAAS